MNPSVSDYTRRAARPFVGATDLPPRVVVERAEPVVPILELLPLVPGVVLVRRVGMRRLRAA